VLAGERRAAEFGAFRPFRRVVPYCVELVFLFLLKKVISSVPF
jgi:hypothetical protein